MLAAVTSGYSRRRQTARVRAATAYSVDFVDRVLALGAFRLRCQRVVPLGADGAARPYYEVLMAVAEPSSGRALSTGRFIAVAERHARMPGLDHLVARRTFEWMQRNADAVAGLAGLAINLSGQSISSPGLARILEIEMRAAGIRPDQVLFEITETAPIDDLGAACHNVAALRALGCKVCIDDLGSGFADRGYLDRLEVDMVKFDGALVRRLARAPGGEAFERRCIDECLRRGVVIVAEQVESAVYASRLRALGFGFAQGFAIERPRWIEEIAQAPGDPGACD